MKFKRLFLFLFLFVFFFVVGCDQEKKDVENIEKLLSQYQKETDVDLSYEYVMSLNGRRQQLRDNYCKEGWGRILSTWR